MYNERSDSELVDLLKKDDSEAFTAIYDRYWQKMLLVAKHKVDCLEDAEEIVQDIFVGLWQRRANLEIKTALNHYLAVAVKYAVIKWLDKQHSKQRYLKQLGKQAYVDHSTQQQLSFNELKEQLAVWVNELPEKCRLVYRLSREEGLPQKKIATVLSLSEKTVEAHLGKATKFLKSKLAHMLTGLAFVFSWILDNLY
ncbi:RNA polymerase sigma-70 factor [Olivibacter sp. SDN3]|uniref:RNA polymerase sigma-70 factor n=1 Tax=Olivibacter sp. SDN3 TaxID=2764720 RepID=UPI0016513229|nr:RNA polymerase sigma-70 factor [Olivibacter sp. SDN3]QNL50464.1 RNA polymerase sigma-70 factor [Olivibacter sp. SDN3]